MILLSLSTLHLFTLSEVSRPPGPVCLDQAPRGTPIYIRIPGWLSLQQHLICMSSATIISFSNSSVDVIIQSLPDDLTGPPRLAYLFLPSRLVPILAQPSPTESYRKVMAQVI